MAQITISKSLVLPLLILTTVLTSGAVQAKENSTKDIMQKLTAAKVETKKGNLHTAKGMLLDLLEKQPNSLRTKAELAMVYYRLAQWSEAQELLTPLLKVRNLPPNVRKNLSRLQQSVNKHLYKDKKTSEKHKIRGVVQVSLGHDSNMDLGKISDVFSDDIYEYNPLDSEIEQPIYGDDVFYGEDIDNEAIIAADFCGIETLDGKPCEDLIELVGDLDFDAVEYLSDGIVTEDGEFIPYSQILYGTFETEEELREHLDYDSSDGFWKQLTKFSHQYYDKKSKFQWNNQVQITTETPFELDQYDRQRIKVDTRVLKGLSTNWFISGQAYYSYSKETFGKKQSYIGIQPELNYLSAYGKFALRLDWIDKRYELDEYYHLDATYFSQTLSWSKSFAQTPLVLSTNVRFAENKSKQNYNTYSTDGFSLRALYALNQNWELHTSTGVTNYDFPYKPSITMNKFKSTVSYSFSKGWKSFVSVELNKINNRSIDWTETRKVYQVGLSWYF